MKREENPSVTYEEQLTDLRERVRAATHKLISSTGKEVTADHLQVADWAGLEIARRHQQGYRQLFSVGMDSRGSMYLGIQLDTPIGQDSVCAEQDVYDQVEAAGRELTLIVTARYDRETSTSHIVPPCSNCRRDGIILFPNLDMMIIHREQLVRLSMLVGSPLLIDERSPELAAVRTFVEEFTEPFDTMDELLMAKAASSLEMHVHRGHGRILTLALDAQGQEFEGLRRETGKTRTGGSKVRTRHKRCSEASAIGKAELAGSTFERLVTKEYQQGKPVVVPPGIRCAGRIAHFAPLSRIITPLFGEKGKLYKVCASILYPFPYKERRRPEGPNGNGGHEFAALSPKQ